MSIFGYFPWTIYVFFFITWQRGIWRMYVIMVSSKSHRSKICYEFSKLSKIFSIFLNILYMLEIFQNFLHHPVGTSYTYISFLVYLFLWSTIWPVWLIFKFPPFFRQNFLKIHIFWMGCTRIIIFGMWAPYGWTFQPPEFRPDPGWSIFRQWDRVRRTSC